MLWYILFWMMCYPANGKMLEKYVDLLYNTVQMFCMDGLHIICIISVNKMTFWNSFIFVQFQAFVVHLRNLLYMHKRVNVKEKHSHYIAARICFLPIIMSYFATFRESVLKSKQNRRRQGPFSWHGLTWIPLWINNYTHYSTWDGITYLFPNFNGAAVEVWEWIRYFFPHFTGRVITFPWRQVSR